VRPIGITQPNDFFSNHVDLRPTMMYLLGLNDDYQHDGRVILEMVDPNILPASVHAHSETLLRLGQIYKQINAPFGALAQSTLTVSNFAIQSNSDGDAVYNTLENKIASWTTQRDALASQIKTILEGAEFGGLAINEQQAKQLISAGQALLNQASACRGESGKLRELEGLNDAGGFGERLSRQCFIVRLEIPHGKSGYFRQVPSVAFVDPLIFRL
jgi:hypothetical protein